ncbi:MAG: hypothetical protein H5T59_11775 [Anaerolineae bacterium]|nr:hypothetical protein [Anaerolineae bacterium]
MRKRLAWSLALVLVLMTVLPVLAADPDPGTGNTDIIVQNTDTNTANPAATVNVDYINQAGGVERTVSANVKPLAAAEFSAATSGLGDGWLGSAVVSSEKELAAVVNVIWTNGSANDHTTGGEYAGYETGSTEVYFPYLVYNPNLQFSRFSIQNVDTGGTANITMKYINRDGVLDFTITDTVPAQAQKTYELNKPGPKIPVWTNSTYFNTNGNWTGAVVVTSDRPIVGVMTNHWKNWAMVMNGSATAATKVYVPSVARRTRMKGGSLKWVEWSIITVQNPSTTTNASVSLTYINGDTGTIDLTITGQIIGPGAAKGYNTKSGGDVDKTVFDVLGDAWTGSVIVQSNIPVVVGVIGTRGQNSQAIGTLGVSSATAGTDVFLPAVYQKKSGNTWLVNSLIRLQNTSTSTATFDVYFYDRAGNLTYSLTGQTVAGEKVWKYNTKVHNPPLGYNWEGSVYIHSNQPMVAVVENLFGKEWQGAYNAISK